MNIYDHNNLVAFLVRAVYACDILVQLLMASSNDHISLILGKFGHFMALVRTRLFQSRGCNLSKLNQEIACIGNHTNKAYQKLMNYISHLLDQVIFSSVLVRLRGFLKIFIAWLLLIHWF